MAIWLHADGRQETVHPKTPPEFSLQELHEYVGGYIEVLRLPEGRWLVLDEDGKRKLTGTNLAATELAHRLRVIAMDDYIVGDALIVDSTEIS